MEEREEEELPAGETFKIALASASEEESFRDSADAASLRSEFMADFKEKAVKIFSTKLEEGEAERLEKSSPKAERPSLRAEADLSSPFR